MLYGSLEEPGCRLVQRPLSQRGSSKHASIAKLSASVLHIDINSRHAAATWQVTQLSGQYKVLVRGYGVVDFTYNRNKVPLNAIRNLEKENHKVD